MTIADDARVLVLGNGPSLKQADFAAFKGVDTIGMNAAYRYWDRIGWSPTHYACLDSQVVLSHADAIAGMIREGRFRHAFLHWHLLKRYPDLSGHPAVTFLCQLSHGPDDVKRCAALGLRYTPSRFFASRDIDRVTTGSASIRFAGDRGYRRIGLIGIDCRYREILPEARSQGGLILEIERDVKENPNYFFDDYQRTGDRYHIPNPQAFGGDLHIRCLETLARDNVELGFGLDIRVLTTESELYTRKVFALDSLPGFLGQSPESSPHPIGG